MTLKKLASRQRILKALLGYIVTSLKIEVQGSAVCMCGSLSSRNVILTAKSVEHLNITPSDPPKKVVWWDHENFATMGMDPRN
jgi:hypothetical protein